MIAWTKNRLTLARYVATFLHVERCSVAYASPCRASKAADSRIGRGVPGQAIGEAVLRNPCSGIDM
jgi:hypothetical protein